MNETVLFLIIGAAVILVGLFLWSRMEAKKDGDGRVELLNESKKMYEKMAGIKSPIHERSRVSLVNMAGSIEEKTEEPFVVEEVGEAPAEQNVVAQTVTIAETAPQIKPEPSPQPVAPVAPVQPVPEPKQERLDFVGRNDPEPEPVAEVQPEPIIPVVPKEGVLHFRFDPLTETVATIQASRPFKSDRCREMMALLTKTGLGLRIYAKRSDNKRWYEVIVGEHQYTEISAVMLLANRSMCVSEMDASRLAMAVQQVAIALEADCETEAAQEIVARARRLFEAIRSFDVQLSFTLASSQPLSPVTVAEAARLAGFTQLNAMRYFYGTVKHLGDATLYLTQDETDRHYLMLSLDAPLMNPGNRPLHQLFSVANDLSARLGLQLQDSRGMPINTEAVQSINKQLQLYYDQMKQANIEPGSPRARLLFARD